MLAQKPKQEIITAFTEQLLTYLRAHEAKTPEQCFDLEPRLQQVLKHPGSYLPINSAYLFEIPLAQLPSKLRPTDIEESRDYQAQISISAVISQLKGANNFTPT